MDSAVRDAFSDVFLVAATIVACLAAWWCIVGTVAGLISAGCAGVDSIRQWYAAPEPTIGGPFVNVSAAPLIKDCTFGPAPKPGAGVGRKRRSGKR